MPPTKLGANESLPTVLGPNGDIDLSGEGGPRPVLRCASFAERFAVGDFVGALSAAELRLGEEPGDEDAWQYAQSSRERLESRYTNRIGSVDYVFNLAIPAAKVKWLGLDPQAGFLLSLVDGQTTVAEVLDLCGMRRLEALRAFTELVEAKAIVRVA